MENRAAVRSPNCWLSSTLQPAWCRYAATAWTIPTRSGQDRVRTYSLLAWPPAAALLAWPPAAALLAWPPAAAGIRRLPRGRRRRRGRSRRSWRGNHPAPPPPPPPPPPPGPGAL